MPVIL